MSELNIELCPETGICSLIRRDGSKVDLMPDEVQDLKEAAGDQDAIKSVLAEVDDDFANAIESSEISEIAKTIK